MILKYNVKSKEILILNQFIWMNLSIVNNATNKSNVDVNIILSPSL